MGAIPSTAASVRRNCRAGAGCRVGWQNAFPRVGDGAGRARQCEDVGAARDDGAGARLDGRGAILSDNSASGRVRRSRGCPCHRACSASGVTSRPVSPVPPVVITTSTSGSSIQAWRRATIASVIVRARSHGRRGYARASVSRSSSVSPDRSSAARAAVGNGQDRDPDRPEGRPRQSPPRSSRRSRGCRHGVRRTRSPCHRGSVGHRPCASAARLTEGLPGLAFIHPIIAQHGRDIAARLPIGDRFDIEQRIAADRDFCSFHERDRSGPAL